MVYQSDLFTDDLKSLLEQNITRDRALQYTSVGIHKDDLSFEIENYPIKKFGSQGQQKSFLIALKCQDMYGSLLATGITSVFALQILVNIAVVTCSMPVTGMPLPLFSYGGTALFINLCAMGILLNISRTCRKN